MVSDIRNKTSIEKKPLLVNGCLLNFIINVFRILVEVVLGTFFLSQVSEMFFGVKNGRLKYCTVIFTSCGVHVFDDVFV